ncbi:MAG: hypothetical protein ACT4PS_04630 [Betaproteobacteria bacterium]
MIELHMSFWKLLVYGAALYLVAVFMIRGQLLKHSLRRKLVADRAGARNRGAAPPERYERRV